MGSLRTSEEDNIIAGEGRKADARDENRSVDEGPKIMITPEPGAIAVQMALTPPVPRRGAVPATPARRGGLGLVIALYLVSAGALAYAVYERFFI